MDVDRVGRGECWLSLGAKTFASEGEETICEGRGEGLEGVGALDRLPEADDSAIPAGVASTNLRFLDDGGFGTCPCGGVPDGGTVILVLHLDHGGGGGMCWLARAIGRSETKPFRGGDACIGGWGTCRE